MDSTVTTKTVSEETCAHDWKMEPAWLERSDFTNGCSQSEATGLMMNRQTHGAAHSSIFRFPRISIGGIFTATTSTHAKIRPHLASQRA